MIFDFTKLQRGRADPLCLRLVESVLMRNWIIIRLESISQERSPPLSYQFRPYCRNDIKSLLQESRKVESSSQLIIISAIFIFLTPTQQSTLNSQQSTVNSQQSTIMDGAIDPAIICRFPLQNIFKIASSGALRLLAKESCRVFP